MMRRAVQKMLATVLIAALFFPQQGYASFRGTGSLTAHITSGSGFLFYINALTGSATQFQNAALAATDGIIRNLTINLGRKKAGTGLPVSLPSVFLLENKTNNLITTVAGIENGTSPNPLKGINNLVSVFSLNLSIVKGTTSAVTLTVASGASLPLGVYTGFIVVSAGILLPTETLRIPISVELY